jgi:hypothetical protein
MDFTEQEASDKVGEYVCVITDLQDFLYGFSLTAGHNKKKLGSYEEITSRHC